MKAKHLFIIAIVSTFVWSCKKEGCTDKTANNYNEKAKKDDGSCTYDEVDDSYTIPTTYTFKDDDGNSTVYYQGQVDRLDQLSEMVTLMKSGTSGTVSAQNLKDMFSNVGDNGNGNFSFSSTKQLKNKCFTVDQSLFEDWMDSLAQSSSSNGMTASNGQAGTLSSGSSTYLFDENGIEYVQLIEKGLMGAVFMNQALNEYFGDSKMDVDNTAAEDPSNDKYYTAMEHHFDEAFGYFGVDIDFPSTIPNRFWGKYCNSQDDNLGSNDKMMDNFLKGRAAISNDELADRDEAINAIRLMWEEISANQAIKYLDDALGYFGNDEAKFYHVLSEAYAFAWNLRYAPVDTRRMSQTDHAALMAQFKSNFWDMTVTDINGIISTINAKY
ncbi:MAG: DUF4856 domain-containing protein [Brumimicrobium sp.]